MIDHCPHCGMGLKFSPAHREKLTQALENLAPGRSLKFSCPGCKTPIELDKSGQPPAKEVAPAGESAAITPPAAPDLSWLSKGEAGEDEAQEDVPSALVLVDDSGLREAIRAALEENNYQVVMPQSPEDAMESMRFKAFEVVVFYSNWGNGTLETQAFHRFMRKMSMKKRRRIFYILVGPQFHTLYDLQALTASANLVINVSQISHFSTLFKKGFRTYEDLFGPYISSLKQHGKD